MCDWNSTISFLFSNYLDRDELIVQMFHTIVRVRLHEGHKFSHIFSAKDIRAVLTTLVGDIYFEHYFTKSAKEP